MPHGSPVASERIVATRTVTWDECRVTTRKPNPADHSEEELLEQWDFLDRLVERQAAQLRAGIQDSEETDEPATGAAQMGDLRRELDRLRGEVRTAEAARAAAEAEARRSRDALISVTATQQLHLSEEQAMRQRHHLLEREAAGWRERAETADRELASRDGHARAVVADLTRRIGEDEAALQQAERDLADAITSLNEARVEIERLRQQLAADQHGFWRFGRR
jgi:chromosome segregation ATPase